MIDAQHDAGVTWVLFGGSTGEAHCLGNKEWEDLMRYGVEKCHSLGMKAVIGSGTNSTSTSIERTKFAVSLKVDACMLVCPYYNKPTQRMIIAHFSTICERFPNIGFMLYNVPGRTGVDLLTKSVVTVCNQNKNIIALKEATNDLVKYKELRDTVPPTVALYTGEDTLFYKAITTCGFHGVVSVVSNVVPSLMVKVYKNHEEEGEKDMDSMQHLIQCMSLECNPVSVKYAASKIYSCSPGVRLPLLEASPNTRDYIDQVLEEMLLVVAPNKLIKSDENQEDITMK